LRWWLRYQQYDKEERPLPSAESAVIEWQWARNLQQRRLRRTHIAGPRSPVCTVLIGIVSVVWHTFSLFLVALTGSFGWSRAETSLGFTIFVIVSGITGPNTGQLIARYAQKSARDTDSIGWYDVFARWKLAIALEGSYAKFLRGTIRQAAPRVLRDAGRPAARECRDHRRRRIQAMSASGGAKH